MNKVILTGHLTATPELKATNSGKSVTEFTIASDRYTDGEKQADFVRCKAWGKQADNLCKYKRQGDLIGVSGALRVDKYKDANGNDKYKTYVLVADIEFLGSKSASDKDKGQAADQDFPF